MIRRQLQVREGLAVLVLGVLFFGVVGPILGSIPFLFIHPAFIVLALVYASIPAALAGLFNAVGRLIYVSFTERAGWRTMHALAGGISGWLGFAVWSVLNGRFRNVPPESMDGAMAQFLRSMFELPALLPFFAGAICAAIFNPWAIKSLQPDTAAQSDAFRGALDAPSRSAPGSER